MSKVRFQSHGPSRLRLIKLGPRGSPAVELSADVSLGDGSRIPANRIRDEFLALAQSHPLELVEDFAVELARRLMKEDKTLRRASVRLEQSLWTWDSVCYSRQAGETHGCEVVIDRKRVAVESFISGVALLKAMPDGSLREAQAAARWTYGRAYRPGQCRDQARRAMVEGFGRGDGKDLEAALRNLGKAVLSACPEIATLRLNLRQTACQPAVSFGLARAKDVFVPSSEPVGVVEGEFLR